MKEGSDDMIQQTCRRCGKLVFEPKPGFLASLARVLDFGLGIHRNMFGEPTHELVLCPECKESLRQWYFSGKENFDASSNSSETCTANSEG
jgi:hypothetical protein